jgi:pimeloyl-ACP methyl ester carboxylesterase
MKLEIVEYIPVESPQLPPLLFVHGAWHGAWCWKEHFLPYFFAKGFSCYALSFRGHGESEGIEKLQTFSLSDYMDDVLEVMAHLKEKPVLIGHSMGGAVVQKIARAYPDKIKMVVLLASIPPQGILKDSLRLLLIHFRELSQLNLFNQRRSPDFPVYLLFSKSLTVEKIAEFAKHLQPESRKAVRELYRRVVPTSNAGTGQAQRISRSPIPSQVPTLVLGSKKDAFFPEKTVRSTGKAYKTQPIIFNSISHDMMLDPQWRSVADLIAAFVSETASTR